MKRAFADLAIRGYSRNLTPANNKGLLYTNCEKWSSEKRWTSFLEMKEMLIKKQFGFREGSSCTANLLSFFSRVIDVTQERDGWVDFVYMDLKKAFDSASQKTTAKVEE